MGYCPWGLKESDATEQAHMHFDTPEIYFVVIICFVVILLLKYQKHQNKQKSQKR